MQSLISLDEFQNVADAIAGWKVTREMLIAAAGLMKRSCKEKCGRVWWMELGRVVTLNSGTGTRVRETEFVSGSRQRIEAER
jgi:hypothetical protein